MGAGVLYANANIIMQGDAYLLTRKRIRDMVAADTREDVLKVLAECNYQTDFPDDAALLAAERAKTLATFMELCDDVALTNCVKAWDSATETTMAEAFQIIADNLPHIKCPSIRQYFTTLADLTNARTLYKGGQTLVPGGTLTRDELNLFAELTPAQVQATINERLDKIAVIDKEDIFKPNPLFWWYLQKQKEFVVVRTILMGKRCHYDATLLRENLRGLYEQFK